MKRNGLSVFLFLLAAALAAQSSEIKPVNPAQVMAWLMSGMPSGRLVRIIQERGINPVPGKDQIHQFEAVGSRFESGPRSRQR